MGFLKSVLWIVFAATQTYAVGPHTPKTRPSGLPTYTPQGNTLDGSDFSKWVSTQAAGGAKAVALASGKYNVQNPDADYKAYVLFRELDGVAVWMDQVTLVLPDNTVNAFTIDHSNQLTTYGPTIWWSVPGFGQATITSSKRTGDRAFQIQFTCDAGYDCSSVVKNGKLTAEYTDPETGLLQAGPGWSTFEGPVTSIGTNSWQFDFTDAYFEPLIGFKVLSRGTFLFCNLVQFSNYTSINDFTLSNCGGFGWFSNSNIRTEFNSVTIKPAPFPPDGGTELPVRASSADGFHSASDFVGPQFDSCLISQIDDDCIAIHGGAGTTTGYVSGNTFEGSIPALPGDTVEFFTPDTYLPIGTAKVTGATQGDNTRITVDALPNGYSAGNTIYSNWNRVGSGFSITNTRTTGNRGRGFIIKASDGTIANNVIEASTYPGIYLGPEFTQWMEAGYVRNITITDNQILNAGYINCGTGAFNIHGDSASIGNANNDLAPVSGNRDITISNLLISNTGSTNNIYIGSASNIKMTGVIIQNALRANYTEWEATPNALVNFQNVQFSGNPDICQTGTGTSNNAQVADVKNYGIVQNGIDSMPQCQSVPGTQPPQSSAADPPSTLSQPFQTTQIAQVSRTSQTIEPTQSPGTGGDGGDGDDNDNGDDGEEDECEA